MGSNPIPLALSLAVGTSLIGLNYLKNRVLTTSEPGHYPGKEDSDMGKAAIYAKCVMASVAEVATALGASLAASVGPLS